MSAPSDLWPDETIGLLFDLSEGDGCCDLGDVAAMLAICALKMNMSDDTGMRLMASQAARLLTLVFTECDHDEVNE